MVTFLYFLSSKSLNLFELETVFRSLIRTFNPADFRYSRSEKLKYIWFFARLFVPLNPCKDKYADAVIIFPHY